jgi:hypothetical protein
VLARVMVQSVRFLALVLGSWHSLVLLPLMVPVLAVRCTLEERMLLAGLESDTLPGGRFGRGGENPWTSSPLCARCWLCIGSSDEPEGNDARRWAAQRHGEDGVERRR